MIGTINKILKKFIGDKSQKDLGEVKPLVGKINEVGETLRSISHDELREKSSALKNLIHDRIHSIEEEISNLKAQAEGLPGTELEQKETIFSEVDRLEKEIDKEIENVLDQILPEAFAIMKETARRFKENPELRVSASPFDRGLAANGNKDYVTIEGEYALW